MSAIKLLAGDFGEGKAQLTNSGLVLPAKPGQGLLNRDVISLDAIDDIDVATEESVKRVGGTVGWGAAGGLVLGPVGLLAGLLLGGRGKDVTFVARLKDGSKLLASTDQKTYKKLLAKAGVF